jgi:hypothetical protein
MAGAVVAVVATAVVNAVAFSASNYVFSKIDKDAAAEEKRKHDDALLEYNRQKDEYNERLRLQNEYNAARLRQSQESEMHIAQTNINLEKLYEVIQEPEPPVKPVFAYQPSDEQKKYELSFQIIGSIAAIFLAMRLI